MTVCVTVRVVPPRWGRAYLKMMLGLARAGVDIDEDAAIERVHRATRVEVTDADGNAVPLELPRNIC